MTPMNEVSPITQGTNGTNHMSKCLPPWLKRPLKIVGLRFLMIVHNILIIWRVTEEKNNDLYWILTLTVALQLLEGTYSLLHDKRIRKRWRPCFVVYFVSVIPSFWILQYEQHYRVLEGDSNSTCSESDVNGILSAIRGLDCLKSSTWFVILLEIFAYILLIGRLLHDSITQKVLTKQMIGFLTNASDIFELFSLFDEKKVVENSNATIYVLMFWTFSFIQFIPVWGSHNLGKTETKDREQRSVVEKQKHFMVCCKCECEEFDDGPRIAEPEHQEQNTNNKNRICRSFCNCMRRFWNFINDKNEDNKDGDNDEGITEKFETGFAWAFQDGPFLILRVYLILKFNLYTQSLIFYSLKNVSLTVLLIVEYRWKTLVLFAGLFIAEIIIWGIFTVIILAMGNYRNFFSE